ncbi:MAG: thioredoxin domain-containing protein [Patescibacteria group bacterium]|jgi:protein-disulfide isomerase
MSSPDTLRKTFLLGSIILGVLIVFGLVWAVSSGPSAAVARSFNDQNDPAKGAESDKIVRIFGDIQCPACRSAEAGVKYAMQKYGDKVRFIWNDFPLQSIHPNALPAANAARCAEAQGKFWEMHDKLYEEQPTWEALPNPSQKFADFANAVGLNVDTFKTCIDKREHQSLIMDDLREGERNGVNGTPTFFFGDLLVSGILTNAEWDQRIQVMLATPAATPSTP